MLGLPVFAFGENSISSYVYFISYCPVFIYFEIIVITLNFIGLACGHFLATSNNVVKEVFTVLFFAHFVKYLGRKILWSSLPIFIQKSRMLLNRLYFTFFSIQPIYRNITDKKS